MTEIIKMLSQLPHRWFAVAYLIVMFFLLPGFILSLSMAGPTVLFAVAGPIACLLTLVVIINVLQAHIPNYLPALIRDWSFLPLWMRSLDPMDSVLRKMTCNFFCCSQYDMVPDGSQEPEQFMAEAHPRIIVTV
jgi:sodium-dependent phosphate cotransporter